MRNEPRPTPTDAELGILQVLWSAGPSTVREVHDALARERPLTYTGVLKLLQIMHEKGLVLRDDSQRTHVYRAAEPRESTEEHLVDQLVRRAFGGSAERLVMRALSSRRISGAELKRIRQLLDEGGGDR